MTQSRFPNAGQWPDAFWTSTYDPRFSYCCHLPSGAHSEPPSLVVAIHGSERTAMGYRDAFADFADRENCVVLAPLFPVSPFGDGNGDGYKYLAEGDLRYDLMLLSMVQEVEARTGADFPTFKLFGFSGGGHFVHRFFYLHPERISDLSIGAPGGITLIDPRNDWWLGTRNIELRFGRPLDLDAMRRVRVQMVIGSLDVVPFTYNLLSSYYRPEAAAFGNNRHERMETLRANYVGHGIAVEKEIVPGVAHKGLSLVPAVKRFFSKSA